MSVQFWSYALQWSRVGMNALVFLLAARVLSLEEIGAFATAFAPIKLLQGLHKSGIVDTVVVKRNTPARLDALFWISIYAGTCISLVYMSGAFLLNLVPSLILMAIIPVMLGISAVSEGLLRKRLALKALALRTIIALIIASFCALLALWNDAGLAALAIFVIVQTSLSAMFSVLLAKWRPTRKSPLRHMWFAIRSVFHFSAQNFVNAGILPITQFCIGLSLGLAAAGAFQIATRVLSMFEALTLSPLRYLALPQFALIKSSDQTEHMIRRSLWISVALVSWAWFGLATNPEHFLRIVVGAEHAATVAPILLCLIPLGLTAAIAMPFTQVLNAKGQAKMVFRRALLTFSLSFLFVVPAITFSASATAIALSSANICSLIWFLNRGLKQLSLNPIILVPALLPMLVGIFMATILSIIDLPLFYEIMIGTAIFVALIRPISPKTGSEIPT